MNADKDSLIEEHRIASRQYREAVRELERIRQTRDPEAFMHFERLVVIPAREKCRRILELWYQRHRQDPIRSQV
jgi:hypothetical protein